MSSCFAVHHSKMNVDFKQSIISQAEELKSEERGAELLYHVRAIPHVWKCITHRCPV